ncbi:kinase-like domain-containing protein [Mycena albidolilacea]|uniref:Kinase-like domain-containing protein n=1 Tax=Mycena albidolilacea TaxID=1033008 RepID=A0AAD7F3P3_9AGAR|nr:kinase-like domain-containing protein [Mycena albidolilacea]
MSVPPAYDAPFGSYPKDLRWESLAPNPMPLSIGIYGQVDKFLELGVVAKSCSDPRHAERLWNIMKLAGDCSVSLVGRIFRRNEPVGIVMPIETPVDADNIATKEERVRIIHRLRELVAELHKKHIVHGDVKPQNLLFCADGLVRFCDFDCASIEGDGFVSPIYTYPYCSTVRARNADVPMTRAEDMYAMALSMWHLYTGRLPLTSDEEPEADMDCTFAGFLPDMSAIDDPAIATLIQECLAAGPERADTLDSGQSVYCITTRFVFGRCKAEPVHRYSRLVHSRRCLQMRRGDGPCEYPFVDPKVFVADLEPVCTRCNKEVEYSGLALVSDTSAL